MPFFPMNQVEMSIIHKFCENDYEKYQSAGDFCFIFEDCKRAARVNCKATCLQLSRSRTPVSSKAERDWNIRKAAVVLSSIIPEWPGRGMIGLPMDSTVSILCRRKT